MTGPDRIVRRELLEVLERHGYRVAASGWTAEYGGANTLAYQPQSPVLEQQTPKGLNLRDASAVAVLHNHYAEQACDDTCTTYNYGRPVRRPPAGGAGEAKAR